MREIRPKRDRKKARVTLLGVISNGSTSEARKLLQKNNIPDATNYDDLEFKLTKLYRSTEDKKALEKDLANIHPHKDFILKYCPIPEKTELVSENVQEESKLPVNSMSNCSCGNPYCSSNYGGTCGALETKSNACGCSGADGSSTGSENMNSDKSLIISASMIGLFTIGIISIFALTIKRN